MSGILDPTPDSVGKIPILVWNPKPVNSKFCPVHKISVSLTKAVLTVFSQQLRAESRRLSDG